MTAAVEFPTELGGYVPELAETSADAVDLQALYLVGSVTAGAYEHGRSDLDLYAVVADALDEVDKEHLVHRVERIPCPARALELVVYSLEEASSPDPRFELNLNLGEEEVASPGDSTHWFVLDRASAEEHAVPLVGPPWGEVFAPVRREDLLEAIGQSLDWQDRRDPIGRSSVLNTCRSWLWLETGEWRTKPEAAAWLRSKVRAALEEAR